MDFTNTAPMQTWADDALEWLAQLEHMTFPQSAGQAPVTGDNDPAGLQTSDSLTAPMWTGQGMDPPQYQADFIYQAGGPIRISRQPQTPTNSPPEPHPLPAITIPQRPLVVIESRGDQFLIVQAEVRLFKSWMKIWNAYFGVRLRQMSQPARDALLQTYRYQLARQSNIREPNLIRSTTVQALPTPTLLSGLYLPTGMTRQELDADMSSIFHAIPVGHCFFGPPGTGWILYTEDVDRTTHRRQGAFRRPVSRYRHNLESNSLEDAWRIPLWRPRATRTWTDWVRTFIGP